MSKSQINLPKTAFSMKANLPTREPEILKLWQNINLYDELRKSRKGEEKFVPVSYTHLRAHETREDLVCRLLLEKKFKNVDQLRKQIKTDLLIAKK